MCDLEEYHHILQDQSRKEGITLLQELVFFFPVCKKEDTDIV